MESGRNEALTLIRELKQSLQETKARFFFSSAQDLAYFSSLRKANPPPKTPLLVATPHPAALPPPPAPLPPKPAVSLPKQETPLPPPQPITSVQVRANSKAEEDLFVDVRQTLLKCAAKLVPLDNIPSDSRAKALSERWKTKSQVAPVSILSLHEPAQHRQLLTNLTTALDIFYGGARMIAAESIEQQGRWETFLSAPELKYVLICDATLWQMPNLLKFYRELPNRSKRFLLNTPVFLLPDLTLYLKDPSLKRSLWKAICQEWQS